MPALCRLSKVSLLACLLQSINSGIGFPGCLSAAVSGASQVAAAVKKSLCAAAFEQLQIIFDKEVRLRHFSSHTLLRCGLIVCADDG